MSITNQQNQLVRNFGKRTTWEKGLLAYIGFASHYCNQQYEEPSLYIPIPVFPFYLLHCKFVIIYSTLLSLYLYYKKSHSPLNSLFGPDMLTVLFRSTMVSTLKLSEMLVFHVHAHSVSKSHLTPGRSSAWKFWLNLPRCCDGICCCELKKRNVLYINLTIGPPWEQSMPQWNVLLIV